MRKAKTRLLEKRLEWVLFLILFLFSALLMFKTFGVDNSGNMKIAAKVWSDFAATIPLIRSFSFGSNFPPEYPIFSGSPIRYHFVFFYLVGMLEKIGLPINWALNIPSTLGFFALLLMIYLLTKEVFAKKSVAVLAVILFLFNSSFGFLEFFKNNPISADTLSTIINNSSFSSFGPYDGKTVSAFWSLNIYTNQRHLALAYASFLFLVYIIYKASKKPKNLTLTRSIVIGIAVGLFPFVHLAVFGVMAISIAVYFLLYPKLRLQLFLMGSAAMILAMPQIAWMGPSQIETSFFDPGYLVEQLSAAAIANYWILNLGLSLVVAPLGFLLSKKEQRKVFIPFIVLFLMGNMFKFSAEVAANHKFFNLFIIGANMFSAYLLIKMWGSSLFAKLIIIPVILFLTLTGIIDFFPIVNDNHIVLKDIPNNEAAAFIKESTPKASVFLNSSYLYNPASIAGRKIFMGWPYFAWSAGYDTHSRGKLMDNIFTSVDKREICMLLKLNKIDYFTIQDTSQDRDFPNINLRFYNNNFTPVYIDAVNPDFMIFSVSANCNGET
jgi:hypothetical protein